jgi:hypothetical protein
MRDADDDYVPPPESEVSDPMDLDSPANRPAHASGSDLGDQPPGPIERRGWVDQSPTITGADMVSVDYFRTHGRLGLEQRKDAAAEGPMVMSVIPGETFNLPSAPGQETARLPTGNFATYVPPGLVSVRTWDTIYAQLASFFSDRNSNVVPKLTRGQRLHQRNQKKGE